MSLYCYCIATGNTANRSATASTDVLPENIPGAHGRYSFVCSRECSFKIKTVVNFVYRKVQHDASLIIFMVFLSS